MKTAYVIAKKAPAGKGVVSWENAQLQGDRAIIDAAQAVDQVSPVLMGEMHPVDWNDAADIGEALRIGAERVYGAPVEAAVGGDEKPTTVVETSSTSPGESQPIY